MSNESFRPPNSLYLFSLGLLATFFLCQLLWPTEARRYTAVATAHGQIDETFEREEAAELARQYLLSSAVISRVAEAVRLPAKENLRGRLTISSDLGPTEQFVIKIESNDTDPQRSIAIANALAAQLTAWRPPAKRKIDEETPQWMVREAEHYVRKAEQDLEHFVTRNLTALHADEGADVDGEDKTPAAAGHPTVTEYQRLPGKFYQDALTRREEVWGAKRRNASTPAATAMLNWTITGSSRASLYGSTATPLRFFLPLTLGGIAGAILIWVVRSLSPLRCLLSEREVESTLQLPVWGSFNSESPANAEQHRRNLAWRRNALRWTTGTCEVALGLAVALCLLRAIGESPYASRFAQDPFATFSETVEGLGQRG